MIADVLTVAWKEWKEFLQRERTRRTRPVHDFIFVAVGGIFIGWQMDPDFGRAWPTVFVIAAISVVFVNAVVPDSFAGERERHTLETLLATRLSDRAILLGKLAASVSYGLAMALAVVPTALGTSLLVHGLPPGEPVVRPLLLLGALAVGLLVGLLMASIGVLISLRAPTARQAHQRLGLVLMGLFITPAILIPAIPEEWRWRLAEGVAGVGATRAVLAGLLLLALADFLLFLAAMLRFRRARLIV